MTRRSWQVAASALVAAAAVVAALLTDVRRGPAHPASGPVTATATVTRRTLTAQTQVNATLGDAGAYTVVVPTAAALAGAAGPGSATGMFTWLPAPGQSMGEGQVLYQVSGQPVLLLYGQVPAYRDLSAGLTGPDVAQLNADLVSLGYGSSAALGGQSGSDYFSAATTAAVAVLQSRLGLAATGSVPLGLVVFLPGPVLITAIGAGAVLGGAATPGSVVFSASSTTPVVTINLNASQQSEVRSGDEVLVTLPDGTSTAGVISAVSRVATPASEGGSSGSPAPQGGATGSGSTVAVLVALTHPAAAGTLSQAPVIVTITTGSAADALTVPVDALLAQPGGGYAVEVTGPRGHHLVPVTPGLFDDAAGLVQVSSGRLAAGQHVVVPGP